MPSPGDELSRQSKRAIDLAGRRSKDVAARTVVAAISIDDKVNGFGYREVTITTSKMDGSVAPLQQLMVVVRSRNAAPSLFTDFSNPTPGAENYVLSPANIQKDDGFTGTPQVQAFFLRTTIEGKVVFGVQAASGDSIAIQVYPMPMIEELVYTWKA